MNKKLFVGNLPYSTTSEQLKDLFASYGSIVSADVIIDRESGRSKGFGFVEFTTDEEAQAAISALHDEEVEGRKLVVNVARPKEDRPPRREYNNDRGGYGDRGGYDRR